ncbi:MAG: HD-GYP domain-containing protein [Dehalococcoidia bacterium]|nr:HD-GYP domain-containing protein [Dehalococcoidia bacterium]
MSEATPPIVPESGYHMEPEADGQVMRRTLPHTLPWALMLGGSAAIFVVLERNQGWNRALTWQQPAGHFWIVSAASIVCLVVALAASTVALRVRNARVLLLALSFLSMAGIFSVHGLATPGFVLDAPMRAPITPSPEAVVIAPADGYGSGDYGSSGAALAAVPAVPTAAAPAVVPPAPSRFHNVTGLSSRLALSLAALFLAASAVNWPARFEAGLVRWRLAILGGAVALLGGYAGMGLAAPQLVPTWLVQQSLFARGTLAVVTLAGGGAAIRFAIGYRRSGLTMYGAVTVGALMLVQAQFSVHFGATWSAVFWLYHFQLLAGFTAILWGVVVAYSQGATTRSFEALTVTDVLEQLRSGYTESIVTLAAALEARDGYTLGHGERVAALSVLIGQEMRLPGTRLRALAGGALLHDVGKIGVPDAVLHKRASLDPAEYNVIKEHPGRGADMLKAAFDRRIEAQVIRHHHERWDGTGYPDRLAGEAIPLEARIAAVADVYDALRSNRAYRPAWELHESLQLIQAGAGSHFDPRCVQAFLAVADRWERAYGAQHADYEERRPYAA